MAYKHLQLQSDLKLRTVYRHQRLYLSKDWPRHKIHWKLPNKYTKQTRLTKANSKVCNVHGAISSQQQAQQSTQQEPVCLHVSVPVRVYNFAWVRPAIRDAWQLDIKLSADIWPSGRALIRPARPERTWPCPQTHPHDQPSKHVRASKVRNGPSERRRPMD